MKKQALVILVCLMLLVEPAAALTNKILEQSNDNGENILIQDHHPSDVAGRMSAFGTTFNLSETAWITNITLWLHQTTNPTCYMNVRLYDHNGTYGVDGLPETPSIANSSILIAPIAGVYTPYTFNFTDDDRIQLEGGHTYVFALVAWNGTLNAANRIEIDCLREAAPAGTYDGNGVNYTNGAWGYQTNANPRFIMRGDVLWSGAADLINDAFLFFNITGYFTMITDYIGSLSGYLAESLINTVSVITQQIRIVMTIYTWTMRWFTRFVDMFLTMGGIITGLLNGTGAVVTQFGNWWTLIELNTWFELIVLLTIIAWFDSIAKRGQTQGEITVFFNDLQIATNIMSYFLSVFSFVIDAVVNNVFRIFDAIT